MREEEQEEWIAYNRACAIIGDIVECRHCNQDLISEEAAAHLIKYHKKEAKTVKKLCRERLDWEKKVRVMNDETIKAMQ